MLIIDDSFLESINMNMFEAHMCYWYFIIYLNLKQEKVNNFNLGPKYEITFFYLKNNTILFTET